MPLPTLEEIKNNPEFYKLSDNAKTELLGLVSPEFGGLTDDDKVVAVQKMSEMKGPTQEELAEREREDRFWEKARGVGKKKPTPIERIDPHIDMTGVEREPTKAIPKAVEHGILGEAAAGLGRGALGVIKTPFDIMDFAGELTGLETLEDIGEYGAKDIEQTISESETLRKSESISKDIRSNPQLWSDPRFYTALVSEGIPHLAAIFIPGATATKMAKTAQLGTKGIKAAGIAGGLGASMTLTGGNTIAEIRDYEERTGETVPLSRKTAVVLGTSAVVGGLDYIPIFKIFGKKAAGNLVSRVLTSMALEGSTEGAQEVVSNFFKQQGYDPSQKLLDNVIEAIVGGALLGGGMGAVSSHTNFQDKLKGTSAEEVSKVLEKAENEIITNMKKLDEIVKKKDIELKKGKALTPEEKIREQAGVLEKAVKGPAEISADVFEKEITEEEKIAAKAELEPDINKFMRRAEKQLEAPIVEVIKKEAQETVDVLNDVAKLGEEARSKENIDRAKAVVKENPELFEMVKGAISVVKEKIPDVKELVKEEVIDKAVPVTKAQEKIEALTDEELETKLEKTTVLKIKDALKAEVKERKRLDKKIDELPETMEEGAGAAEIVLEQVDDDVGRTHDTIDRHQSNVIKYIKDVFSKDEVTIKKHIDLDIWSDELKKSLKKAGIFEKDISEGSTQHLVVRGLKLQNKLRKATDKYLQNNLNKEKNSSTTNALIQIEIDKRSKMSAKRTKMPVMKKKGGKAEDIAGLVPVTDSDEWFTDGRVIINSKPTEKMKKKLNDFGMESIELKKLKEVMEVKTDPVEFKFFGGYDTKGNVILSDTPFLKKQIDKSRWTVAAFQTKDGKIKHLNQFALSVATNRFPDAEIGITSDENALIFYENNKPVALVSTLRKGELDIDKEARKQGFLKKKPVVKPAVKIEDLTDEELRLKRRKAKASKTIEALEVEIKKRKGIVTAPISKKKPKKKPANAKKLKDLISKKQTPFIKNEIDRVRDDIIEDGIAEYGKGTKGFEAHLKENYKFLSDHDMATIINEFESKAAEREIDRGLAIDSGLVDMDEQYSTDIVKPQDTITRTELRKMFAPMKNIVTGINKKGNMYFKVTGRDPVEIKEVDYIAGNINTIEGPIPVGSYLDNVIKLKVKGKGARAGSSTAWHEFMHYIETNGIITDNDIKLLNDVIDKEDVTFEDRATYVGNNLADFKSQKSSLVRRAFKKIADFVNAIRDMIKKTRTAKGVLRDIRTGKILTGKEGKPVKLGEQYQIAGDPKGTLRKAQAMTLSGKKKGDILAETGWRKTLERGWVFDVDKMKVKKEAPKPKPELEPKRPTMLQIRRKKVKAIGDYFNLSDSELRKIAGKDIQLMSNNEFKNYITDIKDKAEEVEVSQQPMNELMTQIIDKELDIKNLRRAMELPPIKDMSLEQIKTFDEALEPFQKGDEFLPVKILKTLYRTELKDAKTFRQVRENMANRLGVPITELQNIKVTEADRLRWDTPLAEKNLFYKMMAEGVAEKTMVYEMDYLDIKKDLLELVKKIKGRGFIVPQFKKVRAFMEAPIEKKAEMNLTEEELALANFMTKHLGDALDYLVSVEALSEGQENYFTHIRRGFLETVKEDGIIKAGKEMFKSQKLDEQKFEVMDKDTQEVLSLDKFFKFALHRTGQLKPTENVAKAFLVYMKTLKKKQALDEILPLIDVYAQSLTPKKTDKEGRLLHGNLTRFVNEWLNTQKGSHVSLIAKQNGKFDIASRGLRMFTSMWDLAGNVPLMIAAHGGEQISTYQGLGTAKTSVGKYRQFTKQGRKIIKKYENFIGESPWKRLTEPSRAFGDRVMELIFSVFRDASIRANKTFLLGSITKSEFKSGEISPKRLAEIRTDMGRYRYVEGSKSVYGATPEGKLFTQYKKWALPHVRTHINNLATIGKKISGQKPGSREFKRSVVELNRLLWTTAFIILGLGNFIADKDDNTYTGLFLGKIYRELTTSIQALNPKLFLTPGRVVSFITQLVENLTSFVKMDEYKRSGKGYRKGELKGPRKLKRQLTPVAIKHIMKYGIGEKTKRGRKRKSRRKSRLRKRR